MNDIVAATNVSRTAERPLQDAERPVVPAVLNVGGTDRRPSSRFFRSMSVAVIFMLWALQFTTLTVSHLIRNDVPAWVIMPRMFVSCIGIGLSFLILAVNRWAAKMSLVRRIVIAAGLAVPAAGIHSLTSYFVLSHLFGLAPLEAEDYALSILDWFWFYASQSLMLLALIYGAELGESEERVTRLRAEADAIHIKLLRYQLNPHFLFNTLNSIASLIGKRRAPEAEAMVLSLSDFLRTSLSMDPARQITLGEEIALQALYLDIERARFPHRLQVSIDVPDRLKDALVPNLITQPLIENAIKYGVARSLVPVRLDVIARDEHGLLSIEVRDDGESAPGPIPPGTSIGLINISERLRLHFGDAGRLAAGRRSTGGFSARIEMPLTRRG
ncbi:sensor histidine kinase [Sphingosinicella ginsenosidimutans]|uniref:Sensor histidine kinase n=2 Tax=Allosphingosinicella ginsenosidimutans TaxID=1176539 RepID=A0A5C6TW78_9SPHN|nr:sensor histidine kinase [Sphingosinicella ginsenosidimutans]